MKNYEPKINQWREALRINSSNVQFENSGSTAGALARLIAKHAQIALEDIDALVLEREKMQLTIAFLVQNIEDDLQKSTPTKGGQQVNSFVSELGVCPPSTKRYLKKLVKQLKTIVDGK